MIQLEPIDSYYGIRRAFFENFEGIVRDQRDDVFQIFVLFDRAQVYPAVMPIPLARIVFKLGAFIGRILGYQSEYEEYTTLNN